MKEGTHVVRTLHLLTSSIVNECFASTYVDLFLVLTATVLASELKDTFLIKGTMSPQAHARVDEQHFEIVGPTESSGSCFHLFEIAFLFGKLAEFFIYKRSLVTTEAARCNIFESFCNGGKAKILRQVICKLVSIGLYSAFAPADIVP